MKRLKATKQEDLLPELRKRFDIRPGTRRDEMLQRLVPDTLVTCYRYHAMVGSNIDSKRTQKDITNLMLARYDRDAVDDDEGKTRFIFGMIGQVLLSMLIKKIVKLLIKWYKRSKSTSNRQ